ncbi:MAG TPA: amidohydrolase family protein [Bryobacteraceae bacterium]|nr:amidohydrolase family protein [Bryobacteraceae bacterium]
MQWLPRCPLRTRRRLVLGLVCLAGAGCKPSPETRLKAIVGAVLIDGTGGAPVSHSVVIVAGSRIRAAGPRAAVPVPASAEIVDGSGRFVVPALVDLDAGAGDTRFMLSRGLLPAVRENKPPLPEVAALSAVEEAAGQGAKVLAGMIEDTEEVDLAFAHRLRDLGVVLAPRLAVRTGRSLEIAKRNTVRLHQAGVAIAVASGLPSGTNTLRELELLAAAGLRPMDVLVAATRNGARAAGLGEITGTLEPGKQANLLVLTANPLEDVRNLGAIERAMWKGEWVAIEPGSH